jgi:RNA polymerase-binding transcription factor DksA
MEDETPRGLLEQERVATLARINALDTAFREIVTSSVDANADDEHDPEGSTVAFERAQVEALLGEARMQLAELEQAEARLADGSYGSCQECGSAIGRERLAARPTSRTCIACASSQRATGSGGGLQKAAKTPGS